MPTKDGNPRYALYARAHDRDPEAMLKHDKKRHPGACMMEFIFWMGDAWAEWHELKGYRRHEHPLSEQDHREFDAWLEERTSAKPKRYRWVCPECGVGKLASSRPKANATVRFCLPCSSKSPELVERTCPTLDKARASKAERRKAAARRKATRAQARKKRRKEQKAREAEARQWVQGDGDARGWDLQAEAKRLVGLLRQEGYRLAQPELTVRRRKDNYTTGTSYGGRVTMTIPRLCSAHRALALLAHELAHEAAPCDEHHGQEWRACFIRLVELGYGVLPVDKGHSKQTLHTAAELAIREGLGDQEKTSDST